MDSQWSQAPGSSGTLDEHNKSYKAWTEEQHQAYELGIKTEREHQNRLSKIVMQKHEEELAALRLRIEELAAQVKQRDPWEAYDNRQ